MLKKAVLSLRGNIKRQYNRDEAVTEASCLLSVIIDVGNIYSLTYKIFRIAATMLEIRFVFLTRLTDKSLALFTNVSSI